MRSPLAGGGSDPSAPGILVNGEYNAVAANTKTQSPTRPTVAPTPAVTDKVKNVLDVRTASWISSRTTG